MVLLTNKILKYNSFCLSDSLFSLTKNIVLDPDPCTIKITTVPVKNPGIPGLQNLLLAILHYHGGSTIHYDHRENNTREETKYLGSENRQLAQASYRLKFCGKIL